MCPRCGECVQTAGEDDSNSDATPGWQLNRPLPAEVGRMIRRRVLQAMIVTLLIFVVLGVMAFREVMKKRRDAALPPPAELPPIVAAAPALSLAGWHHLPPNCNLVFAIQTGPLLVYAERTQQDPIELLTKNRIPASVLGALAQSGIALQQIDHIAGGLIIPDKDEELRVCIVLVLRRPVAAEAAFLGQLHAKPAGPNRYDVQFDKFALQMARASDTIWVFGLGEKDLAGAGGGTPLSPGINKMIVDQLASYDSFVAVADRARWSEKPIFKLLAKEGRSLSPSARAAAIGVGLLPESPTLRIVVYFDSPESAEPLRAYFKSKATGNNTAAGAADFAALTMSIDPGEIFNTLKGLFDDAR
jgi:hypothetical protein